MQAMAVVPLPMKGSKITPPPLAAVYHEVTYDLQRLHRGMLVAHVVLLIAQCGVERPLGVVCSKDLHTLLTKEQDVLRIVQVLVAAGWNGVRLVPRQQIPIAATSGDEVVEVLLYLPLTAEDVDVDALHHAAHLVEHLVRNAVLDVAQFIHAFSGATGIVVIYRRVFVLRPEAAALVLQFVGRVCDDAIHHPIRNPLHAFQAILVVYPVKF